MPRNADGERLYFTELDGVVRGPYTKDILKELKKQGRVTIDHRVGRRPEGPWRSMVDVGFFRPPASASGPDSAVADTPRGDGDHLETGDADPFTDSEPVANPALATRSAVAPPRPETPPAGRPRADDAPATDQPSPVADEFAAPAGPDAGAAAGVSPEPAARRASPRAYWIAGGVAAALLLGLGGLAAGAAFMWQVAGRDAAAEATDAEVGLREARLADVKERIEEAEGEADAAEARAKTLEEENEALDRRRQELSDEIERLTSKLQLLRPWRSVDLVFVDPGEVACGLTEDGDLLRYKAKADGPLADEVVRVARKNNARFVPRDPALARDLANQMTPDAVLDKAIAARVAEHRFTLSLVSEGVDETTPWVSFRSVPGMTREVGFYVDADESSITYDTLDGKRKRVAKERILPGTAVRGSGTELGWALDEADFLEQAVHAAVVRLRPRGGEDPYVSLAVDVSIEVPDRSASKAARPDYERYAGLFGQTGKRETVEYEWDGDAAVPVSSVEEDVLLHPIADLMWRTQLAGLALADIALDRADALTARTLEDACVGLESRIAAKLIDAGVPVMDPARLNRLATAMGAPGGDLSYARDVVERSCVSHVLRVSLAPGRQAGPPAMTVRLVRQPDAALVYTVQGELPDEGIAERLRRRRQKRNRHYFLTSGLLAVLTPKTAWQIDETPVDAPLVAASHGPFAPLERPLEVGRGGRGGTNQREVLVYLEPGEGGAYGSGSETIVYRPLFSKQRHRARRSDFESVTVVDDPSEVPWSDRFRGQVARLASAALPNAGRVTGFVGDRVVVSMGRDAGVVVGDKLRLLRYYDGPTERDVEKLRGGESEELMPVRLSVTDVQDGHVVAARLRTGFEDVWPKDYELREGDLVLPPRTKPRPVVVAPLAYSEPSPRSPIMRQYRRGDLGKVRQVRPAAVGFGRDYAGRLRDALTDIGVPTRVLPPTCGVDGTPGVVHSRQLAAARDLPGAALLYGGVVRPETVSEYRLETGLIPVDGGLADELLLDAGGFNLGQGQLPK